MLGSEAREVPALQRGLAPFRAEQEAEATRPEEDEILQTRIIPNEEVFLNKADWIEAIVKEIKSLEEKKAIRRLTPQDVAYYRREHSDKLEIVPGKAIHSIKAPDARKKCRLVVCGNYLSGAGAGGAKQEAAQLYAGGADTTCLRAALAVGAQNDWTAAALDVKTAFLNAPLCTVEESKKKKLQALEDREEGGQQPMEPEVEEKTDPNRRERLVLMQPPRILIRLGLVQEGEMWMVERALYGLREAPKLWGDHRDAQLSTMEFKLNDIQIAFNQSFAGENLWILREKDRADGSSGLVRGLALVYVDDLLVLGDPQVVEEARRRRCLRLGRQRNHSGLEKIRCASVGLTSTGTRKASSSTRVDS